jgi:hypothetical protein
LTFLAAKNKSGCCGEWTRTLHQRRRLARSAGDELTGVGRATCSIVIRESVWSLSGGGDSRGVFCAATTGEFLIFFFPIQRGIYEYFSVIA